MTAIHTKTRSYSLVRAMRGAIAGKVTGLEGEVSAEMRKAGRGYVGQFSMPIDPQGELLALMYPKYHQRADLTTTTGAGAIFTVPELPLIDLLRAKLVLGRLGATFLTNMTSPFGIPRQTAQNSTQWLAEGSSATPDAPSLDQVGFTPKVAVEAVNISRKFIASNSVRSEAFVIDACTKDLAVALDLAGINGQGPSSNQPLGLLQNSAVQSLSASLAIGTNGGPVAWSNVLLLEQAVALANAEAGMLGYLATPQLRRSLKNTPKIGSSTTGIFCWEGNTMNGYPAEATSNMPSNLAKGTGTNLNALAYGNWADLIVATFHDGIDMLINPFSNQLQASVQVSMNLYCDVNVAHPDSFRIIEDATAP